MAFVRLCAYIIIVCGYGVCYSKKNVKVMIRQESFTLKEGRHHEKTD